MFAPGMLSAPPPTTYPASIVQPRQPAVTARPSANVRVPATSQPKPVIRAQAPEEPKPARPPLLTLPSPEQLGVAVRTDGNTADWTALRASMKELGVLSFYMELLPDGRTRFTCWMPSDRAGLTRRIESVAATETEAVQQGLQEATHTKSQVAPRR